jgi:hypothetical protein
MPLLLVLDDLQWCDRETLEWLHYLLRFDPHQRLLVVGTARLGEIDAEHPLRELRRSAELTEFELAPLDVHETAQLAQQVAERGGDWRVGRTTARQRQDKPKQDQSSLDEPATAQIHVLHEKKPRLPSSLNVFAAVAEHTI